MIVRNTLQTSEANYVYANVLVKLNKNQNFANLSLPEKNSIIEMISKSIVSSINQDHNIVEALVFEMLSFRLSEEEQQIAYNENNYLVIDKPQSFNKSLIDKYHETITEKVNQYITQNFS
jgi:hypothetical protein